MQLQNHISRLLSQLAVVIILTTDGILCGTIEATCNVVTNPSIDASLKDQVTGTVIFTQIDGGNTSISVNLKGFDTTDAKQKHGFHVHTSDNMTVGCNSMGGHFNPKGVNHGSPTDTIRHYGDLGNLVENAQGAVSVTLKDHLVTLSGSDNVIGRSLVVHETEDDLGKGGDAGSLKTGNAGKRLACCVIALSDSTRTSPVFYSILLSFIISIFLHSV